MISLLFFFVKKRIKMNLDFGFSDSFPKKKKQFGYYKINANSLYSAKNKALESISKWKMFKKKSNNLFVDPVFVGWSP